MRAVCGLDVHKDSVYLCILHDSGEIFENVYGVLTFKLEEMRRVMQSHGVTEVTMESTSVYWIPIWRVLAPHGFHLRLVNPYFIKQLPGRKSDVKDAQWIAECTLKDLIRGSFVLPERILQLRQYDRRIFDLDAEIHGRIVNKHGRETILASLTGVVSEVEKDAMRQLRDELTLAEEHKQECHQKMVTICKTYYPKEFARLMTIPGIKERAATSLIA